MKRKKITTILLALIVTMAGFGQELTVSDTVKKGKLYVRRNFELIFQFGEQEKAGVELDTKLRPSLNIGHTTNFDFSNAVGIFWGLNLKSIGYRTRNENVMHNGVLTDMYTVSRDALTIGIPVGIKIGSMKRHGFVYMGGEVETPLMFMQKYYNQHREVVDRQSDWFGTAAERFIPSVFIGLQAPWGSNIKFRYYLSEILNKGYEGDIFGDFSQFGDSQLMSISISMQLKNMKRYLKKPSRDYRSMFGKSCWKKSVE